MQACFLVVPRLFGSITKLMRALLVLLLTFVALCQGQSLRSAVITTPPTYAATAYPLGDIVVKGRIHNITVQGSDRFIFDINTWTYCKVLASGLTVRCHYANDSTPSGFAEINLTGRTDIRFIYVRSATEMLEKLYVWDGDCTNPATSFQPGADGGNLSTTGNITLGGAAMSLAFLRISTNATGSVTCPIDADTTETNYLRLTFDSDTLNDTSGNSRNFSGGSVTYADSPAYPPAPRISGWSTYAPVYRMGNTVPLSSTGSFTFNGDGTPQSYLWSIVDGEDIPTITGATSASMSFPASAAGEYVVRLCITDAAAASGCVDQAIGSVQSDVNGVITGDSSEFADILGPLTRHGTNPLPWYDVAEAAGADALLANGMLTPLTGCCIHLAGTISVTSASPNHTESGFICCNPTFVGTGTSFLSTMAPGDTFFLWWDKDNDGSNTGRARVVINTVADNTHFTITDNYWTRPEALSGTMNYSKAGPDIAGYSYYAEPNNTWGAYDAQIGLARLWKRTELTKYRDGFEGACNLWWVYGLDSGWFNYKPRNSDWHSMEACAAHNHADWWDKLADNIQTALNAMKQSNYPLSAGKNDMREWSYIARAAAEMCRHYPNHAADSAAARTLWCGNLADILDNVWVSNFVTIDSTHGYWQEDLYYSNIGFPAAALGGNFGASPWRINGLNDNALVLAYKAFSESGDSTRIATVLDLLTKSANFIWDYGRADDGGLHYDVLYASKQGGVDGLNDVVIYDGGHPGGNVSVGVSGTTVTGSGTSFLTQFSCNGTDYIGITGSDTNRNVRKVASCADNTHLTLATAWPGAAVTNSVLWAKSPAATSSCGTLSIAFACETASYSSRALSADTANGFAFLYSKTGITTWKDRAQYFLGKAYGGPADGPGGFEDPAGPFADGGHTNLDDLLLSCGQNGGSRPCGESGFGAAVVQGKPYGMSAGSGDSPNAFALLFEAAIPSRTLGGARTIGGGRTF